MARLNAEDHFDLKILNDKELEELFTDLLPSVQNRIVLNGMKSAARIILIKAKSNFKARQKNKSKTGYKDFNRSFSSAPMKNKFGLRVGVKNYKYRWIEWGTAERYYKKGSKRFYRNRQSLAGKDGKGHYVGKIQPTNFFYDAVTSSRNEAQGNISRAIIESLNKTVAKYNNK